MPARLDHLLVARGLFESRSKAQAAIVAGCVRVDGAAVLKPSALVDEAAGVEAKPAHPWVGRGALKLAHALDLWRIGVDGRVVLDVGASTGGFTQVSLSRGAARVYAVDVGRGQLHPRLLGDARVTSLEGTDARRLDRTLVPESVDLIVGDVSFISLAKALPAALHLARPGAELVVLVKPQFEVGRADVGKGGIVRDPVLHDRAEAGVRSFLQSSGWIVRATAASPIAGGDGNLERLLWAVSA